MSICKICSIMTCPECPVPAIARWAESATQPWHVLSALCLRLQGALCLWLQGALCLRLQGDLGAQSCQFASSTQSWHVLSALCLRLQGGLCLCGCTVMLISKFYSIMTCPCACDCKVVCVFAGCTVMSIASSTQSWHVLSALSLWLQGCLCLCWVHSHVNLQVLLNHDMSWVPCACDCKVVCDFAGSTVMSVCKFYSIMTCLECPVP